MAFTLKRTSEYQGVTGPLLLVIMDGIGLYKGKAEGYPGNAVDLAATPNLDRLMSGQVFTRLQAHGTAVGMPSDQDQGNSEVGHNAIGAGRIFAQGAALVAKAIADRTIFAAGSTFDEYVTTIIQEHKAAHFIGLLSDGNVHSHIDHLVALIAECDNRGVERVYIHPLLDGRDVGPLSALEYIGRLEDFLWSIRVRADRNNLQRDYAIASGGGRMVTTMDRYEADWSIVKRGYEAHVMGRGLLFPDAMTAVKNMRRATHQDDQYLPHWIIHAPDDTTRPLAVIEDGDAVFFFNFRGDRAIEISRAFTEDRFTGFHRDRRPHVRYAGIMEYDGDLKIPPRYLVSPPEIDHTISEYLARNGITQFAISETQKFGHVTYFWNGNNSEPVDPATETWVQIESDRVAFDEKPRMKAYEITDRLAAELARNYDFLRVNFANGDMVGHTGNLKAAVEAVETVDTCLGRLMETIDKLGGTIIVTADHGNADMMIDVDKAGNPIQESGGTYKPHVRHTLNQVMFAVHGPDVGRYRLNHAVTRPGLSNIAATILRLLGFEEPKDYDAPLILIQ
ncbi:2,3-bisphosphoglycerate-independent phosphoglycerate mutase [bacterium]|nr:2,3-bisphosphoglycerate-independent phosphoglycerate mutase [candidate division CSSED10-310 bacterium]